MAYEVFNLLTDESHGTFETLDEARGCVRFDRIGNNYEIQNSNGGRVECCDSENDTNPENIYNIPTMRQSIEEDRAR